MGRAHLGVAPITGSVVQYLDTVLPRLFFPVLSDCRTAPALSTLLPSLAHSPSNSPDPRQTVHVDDAAAGRTRTQGRREEGMPYFQKKKST